MTSKNNSRKRAPLGDITNFASRSTINTDGIHNYQGEESDLYSQLSSDNGSCPVAPIAERHTVYVSQWLSGCYNNMLSASGCAHAPDLDSSVVTQWYSKCYENMLSAPIGSHATGLGAPATQQSQVFGGVSRKSTSLHNSLNTDEAMDGLHSPDVNDWYSECYDKMLSTPIGPHAKGLSAPATQQPRGFGEGYHIEISSCNDTI